MTDNDFNTIKPVENLQNVPSLTPTGKREERKRRQNPPRGRQARDEAQAGDAAAEQASNRDGDSHAIDYRA